MTASPLQNTCGRLDAAWEVLRQIPDPEVPAISLCDLGIVRDLRETAGGFEVVLTPTYSGCPANDVLTKLDLIDTEQLAKILIDSRKTNLLDEILTI